MAQHVERHTVHTVFIDLEDKVFERYEDGDDIQVVFRSRAQNRPMVPIKLSYSAIQRLTRDL